MLGLMQRFPMNLAHILEHAANFHSNCEVVSHAVEGGIHRYTYADALRRVKRLANALQALNLQNGDRVATMAWNTHRHFEAWYAIAGQELVCHTINPRLFPEQIAYIANHASDRLLLADLTFVPLLERIQDQLPSIEHFVILCDESHMPETSLRRVLCYETFISGQSEEFEWPLPEEETACSLCYTSGTTGHPKGVLYSHRCNILQSYALTGADGFGLHAASCVLMVVPMFHANSWGLVYAAPMAGSKLVMPGPHMDGASIQRLIDEEQVTFSAAVPTVWNMLLPYLRESGKKLASLEEVVIGGSAVPRSMIETLRKDYGVEVRHAWGMTEMSPVGTLNRPTADTCNLPEKEQMDLACKQGRPPFGVEMCLKDETGARLPNDGKTAGRLMVRGPWVVERYFGDEESALDDDGWLDTGDIATIDARGFMQITDRAKDVIKSGGEWISSVELENTAMGHPDVSLAAVIGIRHPKWEERPLLLLKVSDGGGVTKQQMHAYLADKVPKWWLPEDIVCVEEIPLSATGKINKRALREQFKDFRFE